MSPPALAIRHLDRTYGTGDAAVHALRDVTFDVAVGDSVCIMGRSGSGKSTLLRNLGLIDRPTGGTIELDGTDVSSLRESERSALRLQRFGYVFQEYALLAELTAEENVYLPHLMLGRSKQVCRRRAAELMELLGLADRATHRPSELSGGQQQRVAIARALVNNPTLLFADEPTGNLDTRATEQVMDALVQMNETLGVTIVFVSHDPDHRRYAKTVVHLKDGELSEPEP